jgi:N-acetylglutamate synthase-like GNAT family acetyltransferase
LFKGLSDLLKLKVVQTEVKTEYYISTDKVKLDIALLHGFLSQSYWSPGIPLETLQKAIVNSICFGAFHESGEQVGFARVVSDKATFAYLADVFVLPEFRGKGISNLIMEAYTNHPELQGLRRHMLVTRDAHGLYKKFGFTEAKNPENLMQKHNPDVYKQ